MSGVEKRDERLQRWAEEARRQEEELASGLDERWQALVEGRLSAAESETLRQEAQKTEHGRRAWEALRPFDAEQRSALFDRIAERRDLSSGEAEAKLPQKTALPGRLRWRALGPLAAVLMVGFALFLNRPATEKALPSYDLEWRGGVASKRAPGAGDELLLAPGVFFEILLRPARNVEGEVSSRVFIERRGQIREWPWLMSRAELAPEGAMRFQGRLPAGELEKGEVTLLVAIGRPGRLPDRGSMKAPYGAPSAFQVLRLRARIVAAEDGDR